MKLFAKLAPSTEGAKSTGATEKAPIIAGAESDSALNVGDLKSDTPIPARKPGAQRKGFSLLSIFLPNRIVPASVLLGIALFEIALFLLLWIASPFKVLPSPVEVAQALSNLWLTQGLGQELAISFGLNLQALAIASVLSLGLAYLTVIPIFRPIVTALSKGRFLSLAGFTLVFTLAVGGGRPLKLSLLVFAITVFYLTSMAAVIASIPRAEFDYARTLRMSEWRVVWEVVILGTADKAFEVLRQNAAMGWMMLTLVEGIVRGEGGIGTALLNEGKHFMLAEVFAIQAVILTVGMIQDYGIEFLRRMACPYSVLTLERK